MCAVLGAGPCAHDRDGPQRPYPQVGPASYPQSDGPCVPQVVELRRPLGVPWTHEPRPDVPRRRQVSLRIRALRPGPQTGPPFVGHPRQLLSLSAEAAHPFSGTEPPDPAPADLVPGLEDAGEEDPVEPLFALHHLLAVPAPALAVPAHALITPLTTSLRSPWALPAGPLCAVAGRGRR